MSPEPETSRADAQGRFTSPHHIPLLQVGRDFGGSASGNTSRAGSDSDSDKEASGAPRRPGMRMQNSRMSSLRKAVESFRESGMGGGVLADALGDQNGSEDAAAAASAHDADGDDDALAREEARDRSLRGSVY